MKAGIHPMKSTRLSTFVSVLVGVVFAFLAGFFYAQKATPYVSSTAIGEETSAALLRRHLVSENEPTDNDKNQDPLTVSVVVLCLVMVLILTATGFDFLKEQMEHKAGKAALPIIEKLFGEMTILGFSSICAFFASEMGVFRAISYHVFGNENHLEDMYNTIGMSLSFVMILFVIQVLVLVHAARQTEEHWLAMDRKCRVEQDPAYWGDLNEERKLRRIEDHLSFLGSCICSSAGVSLLPGINRQRQRRTDEVLFKGLRDEFLLERSQEYPFGPTPIENRVSQNFNYGRYLAVCQGQLLAQVVETTNATWACFAVCNFLYFVYSLIINHNNHIKAWTWVALGWAFNVFIVLFEDHLLTLRKAFVDRSILDEADLANLETICRPSCPPEYYAGKNEEFEELLQSGRFCLPMWCDMNPDYYMEVSRSWLRQKLVGGRKPSRQQVLYWMDQMGPTFYMQILQFNLIFTGLYVATQFLVFLPLVYESQSRFMFWIYTALAVAPIFLLTLGKQNLVAVLSEVCSIGAYRRPDVVTSVLREQKTVYVVRTFLVVHNLLKPKGVRQGGIGRTSRRRLYYKDSFTAQQIDEVGKTFDAIDRDRGGSICYDEFKELMSSMGYMSSGTEVKTLMDALDENGDGEISRDEFLQWYADELQGRDDDSTIDEKAEFLFGLFSTDGKGEITLGEFKRKLDGLNLGFSVEDVGALVSELDEDQNGSIGLEEFKGLFYRYLPSELRSRGENSG